VRLLLAVLLLAPAARALDVPAPKTAEDPVVTAAREQLESDPSAAEALARRLATDDRLSRLMTADPDPDARMAAARKWIKEDPDTAAAVAVGLATDRRNGVTTFEDGLLTHVNVTLKENEGAQANLYNRLRRAAHGSKLLSKQASEMSADEQSEILRTMFEGKGTESNRVLTQKDDGHAPPPSSGAASAGPATSFSGYYDRLSAGNLHGYSPKLMAMQSALNRTRPPGAPALVETGKLDYATLSYPAYGMEFDVNNLDGRLRRDRILLLARLAGARLTRRDWQDPAALEAKLAAQVPADKLPPRLAERADVDAKAAAAVAAFREAAAAAKDPRKITRGLLVELGRRQGEAARWITAAALEEQLSAVEPLEGFLSPELKAAIAAVPAPPDARASYLRRAEKLDQAVTTVKTDAETALQLLKSDAWSSSLAEVDRLNREIRSLKTNLSPDVALLSRVPFLVLESNTVQARWRVYLDDLAVKWAPTLSYSRSVAARRAALARSLNAYLMIASGDLPAARRALGGDAAGR
jgi:hypothetical protein